MAAIFQCGHIGVERFPGIADQGQATGGGKLPGNALVGPFGEVQVMDWGLAKVLGEAAPVTTEALAAEETQAWTQVSPRPESSSHTQAGSLIGTPAFIPPEQAGGEIERVNERADVFGLGALLSVILPGKPPYVGETFESVRVQALRGKLEGCFARLDGCGAEPELVALCKQCLAFEPADRPVDAGAVAAAVADLRAAADARAQRAELDRVRAQGESAAARARELEARKRQRLTLALVLALLIGAGAAVWFAFRAEQQREFTEAQRALAEANRKLADERAVAEEKAKKLANDNFLAAREQRRIAIETVQAVVTKVEEKLRDLSGMRSLRSDVVDTAMAGLNKVSRSSDIAALADRTMGVAHQRLGDTYERQARTEQAIQQYKISIDIFDRVAAQEPTNDWLKWNSAVSYDKLGEMCKEMEGDGSVALEYYQKSLALREALAANMQTPEITEPMRTQALAVSHFKLADIWRDLGDPVKSRDHAQSGLDQAARFLKQVDGTPRAGVGKRFMSNAHFALGRACIRAGDQAGAWGHCEQCLELRQELAKALPQSALVKFELGAAHLALGDMKLELRQPQEALDQFLKGHAILAVLYEADRKDALNQFILGNSFYRLGTARALLGQEAAADKDFQEALKLRQELVKEDPNNRQRKLELMPALACCGLYAKAGRMADEFRQRGLKSADYAFAVAATYALCIKAVAHANKGSQPNESDKALTDRYFSLAMEALNQAVKYGYKDVRALKHLPDLDALQGYRPYKELVSSMEVEGRFGAGQ
jgi:tetratricopeptide (TPR) repeat protein